MAVSCACWGLERGRRSGSLCPGRQEEDRVLARVGGVPLGRQRGPMSEVHRGWGERPGAVPGHT